MSPAKTPRPKAPSGTHGRQLVIVESPAKARTIERYLGPGFEVAASVGHIRDLPPKELGVDVDAGFEPKYVTIHGKGKVIQDLKKKAKNVDTVLLARAKRSRTTSPSSSATRPTRSASSASSSTRSRATRSGLRSRTPARST
jgi:hypothetical protein